MYQKNFTEHCPLETVLSHINTKIPKHCHFSQHSSHNFYEILISCSSIFSNISSADSNQSPCTPTFNVRNWKKSVTDIRALGWPWAHWSAVKNKPDAFLPNFHSFLLHWLFVDVIKQSSRILDSLFDPRNEHVMQ